MNPTQPNDGGKLPDKPSALIRVAVDDLEKCEQDPRYEIAMSYWHRPNGVCKVCLAGAVLAQSLNYAPDKTIDFGLVESETEVPQGVKWKCLALDDFRNGLLREGLKTLALEIPAPLESDETINVTHYRDDPTAFKHDMRAMADKLEAHGL